MPEPHVAATGVPGRTCPLSYRHGAAALRTAAAIDTRVLWVAGGLYGNVEALDALLARIAADGADGPARLVFNGDFHWFDADPDDFRAVQERVTAHHALAGNVEAELGDPDDTAGCGCAYPAFVDDATVERSNAIMERLQATAAGVEGARPTLAALPHVLRAELGGLTVGIVHGDPDSLAGWGLAVENLAPAGPTDGERVRGWARSAGVDAFACSHTCLPWVGAPGGIPVINNGSAGMPNFHGRLQGLATRIAPAGDGAPDALVGIEAGGFRFEAVPIDYDRDAWLARFRGHWPAGSPAHRSYYGRITQGPAFEPADALPAV